MALTDEQKLYCKMILEVPTDTTLLDDRFSALTSTEETAIDAVITSFQEVELDTDQLDVDGYRANPDKQRRLLKNKMALLMGYSIQNTLERA